MSKKDAINPSHYKDGQPFECINFTAHMNFLQGNAFKYVWRLGKKDDETQEINKALWYVRKCMDIGLITSYIFLGDELIQCFDDDQNKASILWYIARGQLIRASEMLEDLLDETRT